MFSNIGFSMLSVFRMNMSTKKNRTVLIFVVEEKWRYHWNRRAIAKRRLFLNFGISCKYNIYKLFSFMFWVIFSLNFYFCISTITLILTRNSKIQKTTSLRNCSTIPMISPFLFYDKN